MNYYAVRYQTAPGSYNDINAGNDFGKSISNCKNALTVLDRCKVTDIAAERLLPSGKRKEKL